jgi:hypothetical protein
MPISRLEGRSAKRIFIPLLIFTCSALADQPELDLEPLAMANINCAAFYAAAITLVNQDAKDEQGLKFSTHYALSHQLNSSHKDLAEIINTNIQRQAAEAASLKDYEQIVNYVSKNSIKCTAIEVNSAGIVRNIRLKKNTAYE